MTGEVPSGETESGRRLDSWKEIAGYLGRSVRTVQRWEKEEGLPVYRREAADGAAQNQRQVFAYAEEIDAWWRGFAGADADADAGRAAAPAVASATPASPPAHTRRTLVVALVAAALVAVVVWRFESRSPAAAELGLVETAQTVLEKVRDLAYPVYAVSPDGNLVAYREDPQFDLWVEPVDGSAGRTRIATRYRGSAPTWSADGTRLVFGYSLPDRTCVLRVVDVRTEQASDLWSGDCRDPLRPKPHVWHPREAALLCRRELPNRRWSMVMLDTDSGEVTELFEDRAPMAGLRFSPDGRTLAYSAMRNGNTDIYVRSLSGGDPVRITSHPGRDAAPIWTPEGDTLLFLSQRAGHTFDLWATRQTWRGAAERSPVLVSPLGLLQANGLSLQLLPDESLLFIREAPNMQAVLLPVHPATGATTAEAAEQFAVGTAKPHYLDGGRTLRYYGTGRELVERDLPTGTERITPLPELIGEAWVPIFSEHRFPQAFYGADKSGGRGFLRLRPETNELELFRPFDSPVNPPITWSPGNQEILFEIREKGKARLMALSADGERLREVASSDSRAFARWSPDGSQIAFTDSGCLMTVPRESGPVQRIVCSNSGPPPSMRERRAALGEIAWKPDGSQLAWTAYHPEREAVDIWVVDRATGAHHVVWTGESRFSSWPSELEWSPDASSIAFTKRFQRRWELWKLRNFLPLERRL